MCFWIRLCFSGITIGVKIYFYRSSHRGCSIKKVVLKKFRNIQHRCFPVNIETLLRKPFWKNICKWLLLFLILGKTIYGSLETNGSIAYWLTSFYKIVLSSFCPSCIPYDKPIRFTFNPLIHNDTNWSDTLEIFLFFIFFGGGHYHLNENTQHSPLAIYISNFV